MSTVLHRTFFPPSIYEKPMAAFDKEIPIPFAYLHYDIIIYADQFQSLVDIGF